MKSTPEDRDVDAVVIGAGAVGLAIARELSLRGSEVIVLEREGTIGAHTSSRNSEVIHAGIYYAPGSWKARLCVGGNRALYAYCEKHGIGHRRTGKIIVAVHQDEVHELRAYQERAARSGVKDLELLTGREVNLREPAVTAVAGLFSPSSGIVDSHGLMRRLKADAEESGAHVLVRSPVARGKVTPQGFELWVMGQEPTRLRCRALVNAGGLFAREVATSLEGFPRALLPTTSLAKGHYFALSGRCPFSHLVYPVAVPGGLGTHVTLDLAGQARFGPDVSWVDSVDYSFDFTRKASFVASIQRYFPGLDPEALIEGYTGIRPKLGPALGPPADFLLQDESSHGVTGLLNLFGIESPGLTAALPLAEHVADRLGATARSG